MDRSLWRPLSRRLRCRGSENDSGLGASRRRDVPRHCEASPGGHSTMRSGDRHRCYRAVAAYGTCLASARRSRATPSGSGAAARSSRASFARPARARLPPAIAGAAARSRPTSRRGPRATRPRVTPRTRSATSRPGRARPRLRLARRQRARASRRAAHGRPIYADLFPPASPRRSRTVLSGRLRPRGRRHSRRRRRAATTRRLRDPGGEIATDPSGLSSAT